MLLAAFIGMAWAPFQQLPAGDRLYRFGEQLVEWLLSGQTDPLMARINPKADNNRKEIIAMSVLNTLSQLKQAGLTSNTLLLNVLQEPVTKDKDTLQALYLPLLAGDRILTLKIERIKPVADSFYVDGPLRLGLPKADEELTAGYKIFRTKCYGCHGKFAQGTALAPNLTDDYWKYVRNEEDLFKVISDGKPGTMMIEYKNYLTQQQINQVVKYINLMHGQRLVEGNPPEGEYVVFDRHVY